MVSAQQQISDAIEKRHWLKAYPVWSDDGEIVEGYPLYQSRSLLLLHETQDFHLDGYRVTRIRDLRQIDTYSPRRSYGKMLAREGLRENAGIETRPDLRGIKALLSSLAKRRKVAEIHFDYESDDTYLYLGKIGPLAQHDGKIRFLDLDATWETGYRSFRYDDISSIRFDNEYSRVYAKHARSKRTKR